MGFDILPRRIAGESRNYITSEREARRGEERDEDDEENSIYRPNHDIFGVLFDVLELETSLDTLNSCMTKAQITQEIQVQRQSKMAGEGERERERKKKRRVGRKFNHCVAER